MKRRSVAIFLSLLLPGLGHVYAGSLGLAAVFLLGDALGSSALELGAATGSAGIVALVVGKPLLKVLLRLIALATVRLYPEPAPAGAYAAFVLASIVLPLALGAATSRVVAVVPVTAAGGGFEADERIVARRIGASPQPGERAVYFEDWPDAGPSMLAPSLRQVRVGTVEAVGAGAFTVDGLTVPLDDYGGVPVGVMLSPSNDGMRWNRLGVH